VTPRLVPEPGISGALDAASAARLLEERARRLARPPERDAGGGALPPVLLLAVGDGIFGLPLGHVAGVLAAAPVCPLPGAPPEVLGLRARAGRLHAVLDLARLLGLPGAGMPGAGVPGTGMPGDGAPGGVAGRDAPADAARHGLAGHDVLLRPLPGAAARRRLALRAGRALAVAAPVPIADAPAGDGAVALRARLDDAAATLVAVIDLDRLLRSLVASPLVASPGA